MATASQQEPRSFDPSNRTDLNRLGELPLRATVAFTIRCARRVEPLFRLGQLRAEAFAAGLDLSNHPILHSETFTATTSNCTYPAWAALHEVEPEQAFDAASNAAEAAQGVSADSVAADLAKLHELDLGKFGEPGQPIRWNDPRLGPLWPTGEPAWYSEAKRACYELEEELRLWRDPNAPPDDPATIAMMERYLRAQQLYNEGKLNEYRGEYVFFCDDAIIGHSRNLYQLSREAEEFAAKQGLTPDHLSHYFVPGLE